MVSAPLFPRMKSAPPFAQMTSWCGVPMRRSFPAVPTMVQFVAALAVAPANAKAATTSSDANDVDMMRFPITTSLSVPTLQHEPNRRPHEQDGAEPHQPRAVDAPEGGFQTAEEDGGGGFPSPGEKEPA